MKSPKSSLHNSPPSKPNLMLQLPQDEEEAQRIEETRNLKSASSYNREHGTGHGNDNNNNYDNNNDRLNLHSYDNNGFSHPITRSEMRGRILCYKKTVNAIGILIFCLSVGIIVLYFTTDMFDDVKITDEVKLACAGANQSLKGFDKCFKKCYNENKASCCFASGTGSSCSEDLKYHCSRYQHCSILNDLLMANGEVVQRVQQVCTEESLLTKKGVRECKESCRIVSCCFDMDEDVNCFEERQDLCTSLGACENLYKSGAMFGIGVGPVVVNPQGLEKKGGDS